MEQIIVTGIEDIEKLMVEESFLVTDSDMQELTDEQLDIITGGRCGTKKFVWYDSNGKRHETVVYCS